MREYIYVVILIMLEINNVIYSCHLKRKLINVIMKQVRAVEDV